MIKKLIGIFIFFTMGVTGALTQEIVRPLEVNLLMSNESTVKDYSLDKATNPLLLPFREDFSHKGPYPDSRLWADRYVFINQTFAIHPKSIGTATFDALNQHGQLYEEAAESAYQFAADMLTSHPIRLDSVFTPAPMALTPSDSVLLTFYYQPQGQGSAPRDRDSLVVEFLHTPGHYTQDPEDPENEIWVEDAWVQVWSREGTTLEEFYETHGTYFKRVALKIEDQVFFRPDFRFRFRNYASFPLTKTPSNYAGNTSIWNIDYIKLDYGRSVADSFYYDITFVTPAQSILQKYQAMPWSHYIANPPLHLRSRFNLTISNLDNISYNYTYRYFITDESDAIIRNYSGGTWNIAPVSQQGYQTYDLHANPVVTPNPLPTAPAPARVFTIHHVIREGNLGDEWTRNDTIRFRQVFDNYFAYDDGVPESGYGLVGSNARGAVRFILQHTDTLDAVQFFFNPTLYNQNQKPFLLKIWKNLDPEEILYESQTLSTEFAEGINTFVSYALENPIVVSDTIYVGWQQITNDFLNIGFDFTNDASESIFYNTHGEWLPTSYSGALMIRPVFGQALITGNEPMDTEPRQVLIYPNPATGNVIRIKVPENTTEQYEIIIFDGTGRKVHQQSDAAQINIENLPNGLYFIQLAGSNKQSIYTSKFIIAR